MLDLLSHSVAVIAFVAMHEARSRQLFQQRIGSGAIGNVAAGQQKGDGAAVAIRQCEDLRCASSARAADCLVLSPFSIIDVRDRKNASVVLPKARRLKAGETYRLFVYHYFKEMGTHAPFKSFWINVRSDSSHLQLRSAASVKIASKYDEKEIAFSLDPETGSEAVGLNLALCAAAQNAESLLDIHFDFSARAQWIWLWLRVATITAGLSAAQLAVLIAEQKYSSGTLAVVVVASLIAALASVFKSLPRDV